MTELEARKFADLDAIRAPTLGGRLARWRTALGNAFHELRKSRTASIGAVMLVLLFGGGSATVGCCGPMVPARPPRSP